MAGVVLLEDEGGLGGSGGGLEGSGGVWGVWGGLGTETAKHLPLSLAVQAALGVLALPKEKCNMLQPSQAKLS